MRQTLFRIWFERPFAGWTTSASEPPYLGAIWVWVIFGLLFAGFHWLRGDRAAVRDRSLWITWGVGIVLLAALGPMLPFTYMPVFGYGFMVLLGFICGLAFARHRARQVGMDPEVMMDLSFWLLLSGVVGGRLAYLIQYWPHVFGRARSIPEALFAAVNLSEGGLVLIGAMLGGAIGFFTFCWRRQVKALELADVVTPAAFIGIGFGRIGCLLNGCCFGDRCDLPWAISFPAGSTTFEILVQRGFVDPAAAGTIPLHPTQIYSSLNAFILALVTAIYFWHRRRAGDVFALGLILYPITRFMLEFLRADEMGQLGTGLTISQLYSLALLSVGIALTQRERIAACLHWKRQSTASSPPGGDAGSAAQLSRSH